MGKSILVVAPHPDDETLGCGGTVLKHVQNGDQVHWMIMTKMDAKDGWPAEKIAKREEQIQKVASAYGFIGLHHLGFSAARLEETPMRDVVEAVAKVLHKVQPTTIYLPNRDDVHSDHRISFDAVWAASKTFRAPFAKRILVYETLSETEFSAVQRPFDPNVFVDISDYLEKKLGIMKVYADEVMAGNKPRSLEAIKALATLRGSRAGIAYAEAFHLYQEIC